jgi:hypothetical protein
MMVCVCVCLCVCVCVCVCVFVCVCVWFNKPTVSAVVPTLHYSTNGLLSAVVLAL